MHVPTSILDYWDERRYAHQSVYRFDDAHDGIGELTDEQIMEIQKRKDKMVAEIQTWGVIPYKDANLRGHRLPEVLVSNRNFTPMGFEGENGLEGVLPTVFSVSSYQSSSIERVSLNLFQMFCSRHTLGH